MGDHATIPVAFLDKPFADLDLTGYTSTINWGDGTATDTTTTYARILRRRRDPCQRQPHIRIGRIVDRACDAHTGGRRVTDGIAGFPATSVVHQFPLMAEQPVWANAAFSPSNILQIATAGMGG